MPGAGATELERLGHVARGVAHDFNNLLTVILGSLDQVCSQVPADSPIHGDLQAARAAGLQAAQLVGHVLRFGRSQGGTASDWPTLVHAALPYLRRQLAALVQIEVEATPNAWPVAVDAIELWQVLVNLAANAGASMSAGGRIVLRTANETLAVGCQTALRHLPAGDYAVLRVIDEGCGMDEALQARLFEPFFSTREQGHGLGLGTVARIVSDAGGGLRILSAPGRGTKVEVWLPRAVPR